jgi:hypothetical protein
MKHWFVEESGPFVHQYKAPQGLRQAFREGTGGLKMEDMKPGRVLVALTSVWTVLLRNP